MRRLTSTVVAAAALLGGLACGAGDPLPPAPRSPSSPASSAAPLVVSSSPVHKDTGTGQPLVTEFGIGPAVVGEVSSGAMERDSGIDLDLRPLTQYCSVALDADDGVGVVTNADTLVLAFIITSPDHRTYNGIGVGSTVDEVVEAFGANATVLDATGGGGPSVLIAPAKARTERSRGIYFSTDPAGTVNEYRVGMWPWVQNPRYCS